MLFFILFSANVLCVNAQLLARVALVHYENYMEGANTMYYLVDEERVLNYLKTSDTFNTDSLLTCWGTPIASQVMGDCRGVLGGGNSVSISHFFEKNAKAGKRIRSKVNKKNQKIEVSFLRVFPIEFCKTKLDRRLFGSVPAKFDEALMLTAEPEKDKLTDDNLNFIKTTRRSLRRIK